MWVQVGEKRCGGGGGGGRGGGSHDSTYLEMYVIGTRGKNDTAAAMGASGVWFYKVSRG